MVVTYGDITVSWLGYATIRLEWQEQIIYLDPGRYGVLTGDWQADSPQAKQAHPPSRDVRPKDGDIICLTHIHHYDADAIERVAAPDATIVAFEGINIRDTDRDLPRLVELPYEITEVSMEDERVVGEIPLWTVAAYNDPDGPRTRADGTPFHQKGLGCGFLLTLDETTVFWPGDTDVLPGHEELEVDVFCPPIGGSFTMNRHEAAALAIDLDPGLVVPVHYNTFDALETDSRAFAADVAGAGIPVALDEDGSTE